MSRVVTVFNPESAQFVYQKDIGQYEIEVVMMLLNKLFTVDTFFSIRTINDIAEVLGVKNQIQRSPDYVTLHALHCVHYSNMSTFLMRETIERTYRMFGFSRVEQLSKKVEGVEVVFPTEKQREEVPAKSTWWGKMKGW